MIGGAFEERNIGIIASNVGLVDGRLVRWCCIGCLLDPPGASESHVNDAVVPKGPS